MFVKQIIQKLILSYNPYLENNIIVDVFTAIDCIDYIIKYLINNKILNIDLMHIYFLYSREYNDLSEEKKNYYIQLYIKTVLLLNYLY